MTLDVVLARFNEDIAWTKTLRPDCRLFVYNKGVGDKPILHNLGREAHTYLHHIVENYGHFPDWTFFSQADPRQHVSCLQVIINTWPDSYRKSVFYVCPDQNFFSSDPVRFIEENPQGDDKENDCRSLWNELFASDLDDHPVFAPGAIFAITREKLMTRSLAFYQRALELSVSRPRGPWEFERLWAYLWTSSAATKL